MLNKAQRDGGRRTDRAGRDRRWGASRRLLSPTATAAVRQASSVDMKR